MSTIGTRALRGRTLTDDQAGGSIVNGGLVHLKVLTSRHPTTGYVAPILMDVARGGSLNQPFGGSVDHNGTIINGHVDMEGRTLICHQMSTSESLLVNLYDTQPTNPWTDNGVINNDARRMDFQNSTIVLAGDDTDDIEARAKGYISLQNVNFERNNRYNSNTIPASGHVDSALTMWKPYTSTVTNSDILNGIYLEIDNVNIEGNSGRLVANTAQSAARMIPSGSLIFSTQGVTGLSTIDSLRLTNNAVFEATAGIKTFDLRPSIGSGLKYLVTGNFVESNGADAVSLRESMRLTSGLANGMTYSRFVGDAVEVNSMNRYDIDGGFSLFSRPNMIDYISDGYYNFDPNAPLAGLGANRADAARVAGRCVMMERNHYTIFVSPLMGNMASVRNQDGNQILAAEPNVGNYLRFGGCGYNETSDTDTFTIGSSDTDREWAAAHHMVAFNPRFINSDGSLAAENCKIHFNSVSLTENRSVLRYRNFRSYQTPTTPILHHGDWTYSSTDGGITVDSRQGLFANDSAVVPNSISANPATHLLVELKYTLFNTSVATTAQPNFRRNRFEPYEFNGTNFEESNIQYRLKSYNHDADFVQYLPMQSVEVQRQELFRSETLQGVQNIQDLPIITYYPGSEVVGDQNVLPTEIELGNDLSHLLISSTYNTTGPDGFQAPQYRTIDSGNSTSQVNNFVRPSTGMDEWYRILRNNWFLEWDTASGNNTEFFVNDGGDHVIVPDTGARAIRISNSGGTAVTHSLTQRASIGVNEFKFQRGTGTAAANVNDAVYDWVFEGRVDFANGLALTSEFRNPEIINTRVTFRGQVGSNEDLTLKGINSGGYVDAGENDVTFDNQHSTGIVNGTLVFTHATINTTLTNAALEISAHASSATDLNLHIPSGDVSGLTITGQPRGAATAAGTNVSRVLIGANESGGTYPSFNGTNTFQDAEIEFAGLASGGGVIPGSGAGTFILRDGCVLRGADQYEQLVIDVSDYSTGRPVIYFDGGNMNAVLSNIVFVNAPATGTLLTVVNSNTSISKTLSITTEGDVDNLSQRIERVTTDPLTGGTAGSFSGMTSTGINTSGKPVGAQTIFYNEADGSFLGATQRGAQQQFVVPGTGVTKLIAITIREGHTPTFKLYDAAQATIDYSDLAIDPIIDALPTYADAVAEGYVVDTVTLVQGGHGIDSISITTTGFGPNANLQAAALEGAVRNNLIQTGTETSALNFAFPTLLANDYRRSRDGGTLPEPANNVDIYRQLPERLTFDPDTYMRTGVSFEIGPARPSASQAYAVYPRDVATPGGYYTSYSITGASTYDSVFFTRGATGVVPMTGGGTRNGIPIRTLTEQLFMAILQVKALILELKV